MKFQILPSLLYVILMGFLYSSEAYNFYVGGKDGWGLNPSLNYNQWAEKNRFSVNDSLVFKYKKGSDSVLVVSKEDYDKCNTKNPIKTLEDGNSIFKFDRSGPFYFISGKEGNCDKGEKLIVVVLAVRTKTPPFSSPPKSQPPTIPSPTAQPPKAETPKSSPPKAQPPTVPSPIAQPPKTQTPKSSPSSPIAQPPKTQTPKSSPSPSPIANPPKSSSSSPSPSPTSVAPKVSPSPATTPVTAPSPSALTPASQPPSEATPTSSPPGTSPSTRPASSPANKNNTSDITAPPPVRSSSPTLVSYSSVGFVLVTLVLGSFVGSV